MKTPKCVQATPELEMLFEKVNYFDVKSAVTKQSMREFIAGALSYQPGWITFLYGVRMIFVRFLGMKQEGVPKAQKFKAEDISLTPGEKATFFTVTKAKDEHYWVVEANDKHLKATLLAVVEPLTDGLKRINLITLVYYHNWAGPVYFNVIRPFHHLVVQGMINAALRQERTQSSVAV
jgi:Protein of unknown function (DUF2867)